MKPYHAMLLTITILVGCAKPPAYLPAQQCTVTKVADGADVACPDGSKVLVANGSDGAVGSNGVNGTNGATGAQGAQGPQGVAGANGSNGVSGVQGAVGPQGPQGPQGLQGIAGAPGTTTTTVEFCPNSGPPVYPSRFPEYGIVINGVMFGVYSTNGGFLAELPPGAYTSNGVGSSCNFTINPDNTVTQN